MGAWLARLSCEEVKRPFPRSSKRSQTVLCEPRGPFLWHWRQEETRILLTRKGKEPRPLSGRSKEGGDSLAAV